MLKCEDRTALEAVIEESDSSYIYDIPSEDRKPREDLLKVVFGPPTSPEPFTQRSQSRSVTAASSTSPSPSPSPSPSRSRTGSPATSRFYCQPCKKGFGSKSTWDSHCKSSKHLSNVASPTKKASSTRNVNPAMRQAIESISKARRIAASRPDTAVTVLWNISQDLATGSNHKDLFDALYSLRDTLQSSPDLSNAQSPISAGDKAEMAFLADLAIARIYARLDELEPALLFYVSAMQRKGASVSVDDVGHLAQRVRLLSHDVLLSEIEQRMLSSNANFEEAHSILVEAGCLFAQQASNYELADINFAWDIAVVLYSCAVVSGRTTNYYNLCGNISTLYDRLDMPWASYDCLMKVSVGKNCPAGCIAMLKAGIRVDKLEDRLRMQAWLDGLQDHHQTHFDLMLLQRRLHNRLSTGGASMLRNWHDFDMIESLIQIDGEAHDTGLVLHSIPSTERGRIWLELSAAPRRD